MEKERGEIEAEWLRIEEESRRQQAVKTASRNTTERLCEQRRELDAERTRFEKTRKVHEQRRFGAVAWIETKRRAFDFYREQIEAAQTENGEISTAMRQRDSQLIREVEAMNRTVGQQANDFIESIRARQFKQVRKKVSGVHS